MRLWLLCDLFVRIASNALLTAKFVLFSQERHDFRVSIICCKRYFSSLRNADNTNARAARAERERERERKDRLRERERANERLHMSAAALNDDDNTENKREFLLRKEEDFDEFEEEENNRRRRQLSRLKRERLCRLQKNILASVVLFVVLFVIMNVITKMNEVRTT
jgi:hypothetical protein